MSVINQSDIEHIDEAVRKFANQKNMNGFAAILIGFTDDGDHTCLIAKGELNRVDMLYCFSKGIQNLFERMDALKQDGGVQRCRWTGANTQSWSVVRPSPWTSRCSSCCVNAARGPNVWRPLR